jgi:hypothetical protein
MSRTVQEQRERRKEKKKERERKNKARRKKDVIQGLPFIIAFQGDPARHFRCGQSESLRQHYDLINLSKKNKRRNASLFNFNLLNQYKSHPVLDFGIEQSTKGLVYIKNAPQSL